MTWKRAVAVWCFLALGNVVAADVWGLAWSTVCERSFFQAVAIVAVMLAMRESRTGNGVGQA